MWFLVFLQNQKHSVQVSVFGFLRGRRDLNPRSIPWQGIVLTRLHHGRMRNFRLLIGCRWVESDHCLRLMSPSFYHWTTPAQSRVWLWLISCLSPTITCCGGPIRSQIIFCRKFSRPRLVCPATAGHGCGFRIGTHAKQFACSPANLLRGADSNGRLKVMSLVRYHFSTPRYLITYN